MQKKKDLITTSKAAKITGLSRSTINRKLREGIIEGAREGRTWFVSKKSVHQAIADGTLPTPRRKWGKKNGKSPCEADDKLVRAYRAAMTAHFMETDGLEQPDAEVQADSIARMARSLVPVL